MQPDTVIGMLTFLIINKQVLINVTFIRSIIHHPATVEDTSSYPEKMGDQTAVGG